VQALVAYSAAFALTFACSTGVVLLVGAWRSTGHPALVESETRQFALSASGLMACAFVEAVVLGLVALAARRVYGDAPDTIRLEPSRASWIGGAAAVLGLVGLSTAGGAAIDLLRPSGTLDLGTTDAFAAALAGAAPLRLLLAFVTIGLAPAVAEEVFFRGLLQPLLTQRWGRTPAIILTAAAFGVFHLDRAQGTVAFFAGLLLGWIVERFGSVRPAIAAHAINNVLFVAVAAIAPEWASAPQVQPWMLACGAVVCAGAVATLASSGALRTRLLS
jgi:membrane protease YdiL (CAAX protease family)